MFNIFFTSNCTESKIIIIIFNLNVIDCFYSVTCDDTQANIYLVSINSILKSWQYIPPTISQTTFLSNFLWQPIVLQRPPWPPPRERRSVLEGNFVLLVANLNKRWLMFQRWSLVIDDSKSLNDGHQHESDASRNSSPLTPSNT